MARRRSWCLGPAEFKAWLLEQIEGKLGEHHSGQMRQESAEARAERIIGQELRRRKWSERDPAKVELAARLRRETTLSIRQLAQRLHLGAWQSLNNQLYVRSKRR